jgi:hypothetical protein
MELMRGESSEHLRRNQEVEPSFPPSQYRP